MHSPNNNRFYLNIILYLLIQDYEKLSLEKPKLGLYHCKDFKSLCHERSGITGSKTATR